MENSVTNWQKCTDGIYFAEIKHKILKLNISYYEIKPLADRVLIEPKEAETKTAGGLFIRIPQKKSPAGHCSSRR